MLRYAPNQQSYKDKTRLGIAWTSGDNGEAGMVSIKDFQQLEFKIAQIDAVEPHPNADKLWILRVSIGEEKKQLVAGIRAHYAADELVGKKIVVLNNLEPAVIRGVESQGMLLAAGDGTRVVLLTPDREITSGATVK